MSVKRKFRKSKKTKGKSKSESKGKNNKYNNEKRSKIQRKTKKRVLRGGKIEADGRIAGIRKRYSILPLSLDECNNFFKDITRLYSTGIPPDKLQDDTQGKTDFEYCKKKFIQNKRDSEIPKFSPPSTPAPEPEGPVVKENAGLTSFEETDDAGEKRLEAEAVAAEEKKSQKIQEASNQVEKDSEVQTEEIPNDSAATLLLYKQHGKLAKKYVELEATEQYPEIKEIYRKAKDYHNRVSSTLWLILQEREETEQANTSQLEGAPNVEHQPSESDADADVSEKNQSELDAIQCEKLQKIIQNIKTHGKNDIEKKNSNVEAKAKALVETSAGMKISTEEIPNDSDATLELAQQHHEFASKYKALEDNETDSEIKTIYMSSKNYHEYFYKKLQEAADVQKQDALEKLAAAPIEPEIVDDLKLFPRECFGKYSICKEKINEAENQSFFCYKFFKRMKEFFIKRSPSINFDNLLSDDNAPRFSASRNFIEQYLNFFEFYNQHMASGDNTKKFFVKRDGRGGVDTYLKDDKTYIAMEKYPEIDLKTFFDNCYKLYELSLPQVCYLRLADSAYDNEELRDVNNSMTIGQMRNKISNFTPTIFSPTSKEKNNLDKVIQVLSQYKQKYRELNEQFRDSKLFLELRAYNNILPNSASFSSYILPVIKDNSGHSLLDLIEFIVNKQLLFPVFGIVCTASIDKTRASVREGIQKIIIESQRSIREIVDNGSIFTTTCQFIEKNSTIKEEIIELLEKNNKEITDPTSIFADFKFSKFIPIMKEETDCAQRSINFVDELKDPFNNFKTYIFFHMIIFACYNTMNSEKGQWGIKGTTLMILFMNIFIINFFIDILRQVNASCLQFLAKEQGSVILIDENVSTLLEFIIALKSFLLDLKVKKKTKGDYNVEDVIRELYDRFEKIQGSIKERNNENLKFIEGLDEYPQDSTESDKSNKSNKTKFQIMHEYYLRIKMIDVCTELEEKVIGLYTPEDQEEIKKRQSEQPVLELSGYASQMFDPDKFKKNELEAIKKGCKDFVVSLISVARAIRANKYVDNEGNNISKVHYDGAQLNQLNTCCDPRDIFSKGADSREYFKRISRAYYGLSELWPYIKVEQKPTILKLPGVRALIYKFNTDTTFREKVEWQCNDDGKAEKKGGLIWWGKSENRKNITQNIEDIEDKEKTTLPEICKADVVKSPFSQQQTEPDSRQVVKEITPRSVETLKKLVIRLGNGESAKRAEEEFARVTDEVKAEDEAEALKNPKLTEKQKDNIRKNNKLQLAMSYAFILNNENLDKNSDLVQRAQNFADENKVEYLEAETLLFFGQEPPKHKSENASVQANIDERQQQRTKINNQIKAGTYEPRGSTSLVGKFRSMIGFGGGTTLTKTKHKSNHKAKAKTQSKPKHKNKSKPKPKPKHRTKAKTIKKNKRAHHKFDKKYTRKH
jgi:hypothetical protein